MPSIQETETEFTASETTLIRYVEVWEISEDQTHLELDSAMLVGKKTLTRPDATSVGLGEGLTGRAWAQKTAMICHEESECGLPGAEDTKLACMVAVPVFRQQEIRGVVVLGLGDGFGATEVWSRDDRDELSVTSGHYSGLPSFEFITGYTRFPKGAGVPGNVWKSGRPIVAQNLDKSSAFIRSFGNDPAVVTSAIGLPICSSRGFPASVLLLLEAADCPLAGRTELWRCETSESEDADHSPQINTNTVLNSESNSVSPWQRDLMSRVTQAEGPVLVKADSGCSPANSSFAVAMPVFHNSELAAVLAFTF